jgi:hypothetical protein
MQRQLGHNLANARRGGDVRSLHGRGCVNLHYILNRQSFPARPKGMRPLATDKGRRRQAFHADLIP